MAAMPDTVVEALARVAPDFTREEWSVICEYAGKRHDLCGMRKALRAKKKALRRKKKAISNLNETVERLQAKVARQAEDVKHMQPEVKRIRGREYGRVIKRLKAANPAAPSPPPPMAALENGNEILSADGESIDGNAGDSTDSDADSEATLIVPHQVAPAPTQRNGVLRESPAIAQANFNVHGNGNMVFVDNSKRP